MNRAELQLHIDYAEAMDRLQAAKDDYATRRASIPPSIKDRAKSAIDLGDTVECARILGAWVHQLDRTELDEAKNAVREMHRYWRTIRTAFTPDEPGVAAPEAHQVTGPVS